MRSDEPEVLESVADGVLTLTFNRPASRNAMTPEMYEAVHDACERADADDAVRVLVLRGAGTEAFVSGTDIGGFTAFADGADGIAYERGVTRVVHRLEDVDVPSVAVVRGHCLGGGLALAAACDLRLAAPSARFGVPIARTLGNCLSMDTYALLQDHFGPARCLDMLLTARTFTAAEAAEFGFVRTAGEDALDEEADRTVALLRGHAPLTMWAAKEMRRRLRRAALPAGDEVVARVYASADFRSAARAFVDKRRPEWTGR